MLLKLEAKYLDAIKLSLPIGPLLFYVEKYFFNDWEFLKLLLILMALDFAWGFTRAWRTRTISQEGFAKMGKKLAEYGTLLILGHVFLNARSGGESMPVFSYVTVAIHSYLLVREGISILEKLAISNPKLVPDWILDRLKIYRDSGKIKTDDHGKEDPHSES
ncbi:phage holin family protein [Algoriphagus halophytocola]|uniref:phage holin family protein n=1 Tax=Algoriphagus halophytocola TaxID=2991499 RepID=UPI0022DE568E|nr:phage holin family protein [Algoriphagus sp. TR-M9]WBL42390.1 phage holin family protein [Algoriphagus sp. TR-M9]